MKLNGIYRKSELANAFESLRKQLDGCSGASEDWFVSWKHRGEVLRVKLIPSKSMWYCLNPKNKPPTSENRYWNVFGTQKKPINGPLSVICEINFPKTGRNLRCAGRFGKDNSNNIYLLHSGRIGGGRKGVGKTRFRKRFDFRTAEVSWDDKRDTKVTDDIIIGKLSSKQLVKHISVFLECVKTFKSEIKRKT